MPHHSQFPLLRDSFLDLIPALCFHIHGWEDGSLCQNIRLIGRHKTDIGDELQGNDRITPVPDQRELTSALRTVNDEIRIVDLFQRFDRNQFGFVFRFCAWYKRDILCTAIGIGAIKRRKAKTIFYDGVFQFLSVSSVLNAYGTILLRSLGFEVHPR